MTWKPLALGSSLEAQDITHPASVQVEGLLGLISVQSLLQVSMRKEDASSQERMRLHTSHPLYPAGKFWVSP